MNPVQNRSFIGAIAAAVVSFCRTFIRSMTVLEDVVGMGEGAVKSARKRQVIDLAISESNYANRAIAKAALEQARQEVALREFAGTSEEHRLLMDKARESITNLVKAELNKLEIKEEE